MYSLDKIHELPLIFYTSFIVPPDFQEVQNVFIALHLLTDTLIHPIRQFLD